MNYCPAAHPFDAPDAQRLMYKLSFEEPRPIHELVPELPPGSGMPSRE